jgi:hypothetical protein
MQCPTVMLPPDHHLEDADPDEPRKWTDPSVMRILERWIAMHDGVDDKLGTMVDRHFVVAECPG